MHNSLEYRFFKEFESDVQDIAENDTDRYFDTLTVKFILDSTK